MLAADQEARRGSICDWDAVEKADAERRQRARILLQEGKLSSAEDYYAAAFIFQHGDKPEDYLLAHVLAVRALGLGLKKAEWIAAAALDRYLQAIEQKQVYGTQYSRKEGEPYTQGAYDRELLTDQIRDGAGVRSLAEQAETLKKLNEDGLQTE